MTCRQQKPGKLTFLLNHGTVATKPVSPHISHTAAGNPARYITIRNPEKLRKFEGRLQILGDWVLAVVYRVPGKLREESQPCSITRSRDWRNGIRQVPSDNAQQILSDPIITIGTYLRSFPTHTLPKRNPGCPEFRACRSTSDQGIRSLPWCRTRDQQEPIPTQPTKRTLRIHFWGPGPVRGTRADFVVLFAESWPVQTASSGSRIEIPSFFRSNRKAGCTDKSTCARMSCDTPECLSRLSTALNWF